MRESSRRNLKGGRRGPNKDKSCEREEKVVALAHLQDRHI
jgi:hypothetical protein